MIYSFKTIEEAARGVAVAIVAYGIAAIGTGGVPTTREGLFSLIAGAIPIAYAAFRAAFTKVTTPVAVPPTPPAGSA